MGKKVLSYLGLYVKVFLLFIALTSVLQVHGQKVEFIPKISSTIIIDGQREEIWDSNHVYSIENVFGGLFVDTNDFSGNWTALWDDQNIYFFFQVKDDSLYNLGPSADKFWIHDCVEIFFDILNDKDDISTDESADDDNYQYRYIWDLDDEPIFEQPPVTGMENISYTVVESDKTIGYNIEVKIPWATLIQTHDFGNVIPGRKIGIEFKLNDLDVSSVPVGIYSVDAELLWNNTTQENLKLCSNFGTVQLINNLTGDNSPPLSINNLSGITTGATSVALTWTAPQDENTGSIFGYDIRFSSDSTKLAAWDEANVFIYDSIPVFQGLTENIEIGNLPLGTKLFFGVKSIDVFNNVSDISNIFKLKTLEADSIKPGYISDLAVDSLHSYAVGLFWTAPGDDVYSGIVKGYDIRYSESELNEENWEGATEVLNMLKPLVSGSIQSIIINGLLPEKTYFFGVKSYDESPNYSAISNIIQVTTPQFINPNILSVDQSIGTNSFIDVPFDKIEAVSFVREYHPWSFTEIEDDVFEYNRWNGYWNFDKYYTTLKEMGITVCPALWSSPSWLESDPLNKPVGDSENPEDPKSYSEMAQFMYQYAARYGDTEVDMDKILVNEGQVKKTGLGVVKYFEDWNEQDRDWAGRDAWFYPKEYAAMASANVDGHAGLLGDGFGVKTADPTAKFVMGGLYQLNTDYLSEMREWFIENRADQKWPIDVINMHHYAYTYELNGISPEAGDYKSKVQEIIDWRNEYAPKNEVWITEFGYDTNDESPNRINVFGGFDQHEIQAQWLVRTFLILSSVGIDRVAQFMIRDVGGSGEPRWRDSGLTLSSDEGYVEKTSWYYVSTLKYVMKNMYFDKVVSETNNTWVYRYKDEVSNKFLYVLWSPTSDGVESDYRLKIPEDPTYLYQVEMVEDSAFGLRTNLTYTTDLITIGVSEKPLFFVTGYGEPDGVVNTKSQFKSFVYPNPVYNEVNISIPDDINLDNCRINMFSVEGKIVEIILNKEYSNNIKFSLDRCKQGIYIIQISDDKHIYTDKIIKYKGN